MLIAGVALFIQILATLAYSALQNVRYNNLEDRADQGNQNARTAIRFLEQPSKTYITFLLTVILTGFVIALTFTVEFLLPVLAEGSALMIGGRVALIMLSGVMMYLVSINIPEAIGYAAPYTTMGLTLWAFRLLMIALHPLSVLFSAFSNRLARAFGREQQANTVTQEEIMTLVNAGHSGGTIEPEEKAMILSVLQLDQTLAREMMVPRIDMVTAEVNTDLGETLNLFITTGFSRIPVYEENIDNIVGLLYAKDLLNLWHNGGLANHTVRELVRSAYFIPENRTADELLRDLQARNVHMAIVVDEYGGTSGLVTIENIIEEIVGDIRDEYDQNEEYEYVQNSDDEYVVDAGMDLDDLNELLDIELQTDDADTLGGLIYRAIGRVPIVGETLDMDEVELRVRSLEGRRIRKVQVKLKPREQQHLNEDRTFTAPKTPKPPNDEWSDDDEPLADAS